MSGCEVVVQLSEAEVIVAVPISTRGNLDISSFVVGAQLLYLPYTRTTRYGMHS